MISVAFYSSCSVAFRALSRGTKPWMSLTLNKNSRIDAFHAQTHEPNDNAYPFLSSMFHSLLPFCAHRQTGWHGRAEEKEERKEVSKKEKKAGAVNDAMPKAPRLSFGSVLSVCKAKAQVERRTDRQMNSSSVSGISLPPVRASVRPCDRPTRAPHSLYGD